jgi:repressor LexA
VFYNKKCSSLTYLLGVIYLETIGERIKMVRKDLKLSQEAFGEKVKVTKAYISHIENSTEFPSDMLIKLICLEYNLNDEWLRSGTGEKYNKPVIEGTNASNDDNNENLNNLILYKKPYLKKYMEILNVLGPSGASPLNIPFLDEPDLIDIFNYLQYCFSTAKDLKEKMYIIVKFENCFPFYQDVVKNLKSVYLKDCHTYSILKDKNGDMPAVADSTDEYKINNNIIYLPILGDTAAGIPIEVNEYLQGYIPVNKEKARNKSYLVRARGDSMIGAGINDGDFVLIYPQPAVENGEIALVNIRGESTIKYVYITDTKIELRPANNLYQSMFYPLDDTICIKGKVIEIILKETAETHILTD